ncbi:divergent protein kinase domain 1A-like [Phyllopteryx taeniolatus]|uniref:divergent protein kinase domain 1A-like n=1 Tax=Phyllopteryx taeniolatus TaxID=161469 RepID=UPI002AD2E801|nr:divergent protein kinase domain 1A-like [Phyllopteryx taeniolatus]
MPVCRSAMARAQLPWRFLVFFFFSFFRKPLYTQARLTSAHLKCLLLCWLAVLAGSWVVYAEYSSRSELCRGRRCTADTCAKYRRGLVDGSACGSLCDKNTLELNKCLSTHATKQVYSGMWGDLEGVVRCQMDEVPAYDVGSQMGGRKEAAALFDTPSKGTSMEKFREMILDHLKTKVGEEQANLGELTLRALAAADANKDGHISLAEARSAWALLQLDDFLLALALQERGHMPKILGFCGDLYVTEKVPNAPLYGLRAPARVPAWVRRTADHWFTPTWPHRAKISIGLLELVEDLFHGAFGSFLMCDLSAARFGYTGRHDLKVADAGHIVPEATFREAIREQSCEKDTDCVYGVDCFTSCDLTKRRCTPEVAEPNLAKACRALEDYVLSGAPSDIREELEEQLYACMALRGSAERAEIQHSLVLNNLKTLLWKKISHNKDS